MTSRRHFLTTFFAGTIALLAALPAAGRADRADDLQARFRERFAAVRQHKDAGRIGETSTGLLDAVRSESLDDAALRKLVDSENADRRELYELIAKKESTTADVVARTNAARNFKRAKAGDYLKGDDGQWRQK